MYGYFRYDDDDTVMVIFNLDTDDVDVDMARFAERLQGATRATNILDGSELDISDSIELEPRSVLVLDIQQN